MSFQCFQTHTAVDKVNYSTHSLLRRVPKWRKKSTNVIKNRCGETGMCVGGDNSLIVLLSTECLF